MAVARSPVFVVVPVRGLIAREPDFVLEQLETVDWIFVGTEQFDELARASSRTTSLRGNLEHIWKRLHPDALLLVKCFGNERRTVWDERRADVVLSAVNLAMLLSYSSPEPEAPQDWPAYVFRTRYREYCDLPLSFDMAGTDTTGHTGRLGLLNPQVHISLPSDKIRSLVRSSSSVLERILNRERLTDREARLRDAAVLISQAFDTLSPGAFASQMVAMAENLIDSQSDDATGTGQWKRRLSRMKALMPHHAEMVDRITDVRHNYVHNGKQPDNDLPALNSLAFAVEAWWIVSAMYEKYQSAGEVQRILDCAALAKHSEVKELSAISALVPEGPSSRMRWISKSLCA